MSKDMFPDTEPVFKREPTSPSVWEVCACNHAKESHTLDGVCLQRKLVGVFCTCMKFEPVINVPKPSVVDDYCPGHCGACDEKHRRIEEAVAKQTEGLMAQLGEEIRGLRQSVTGLEGSYEAAARMVVELREELVRRNQDIADWQLRHRNLSKKYAALRAGVHGA